MGITINTEPIDVDIDGTIIWFQGDPSATPAWDRLLELGMSYKTKTARAKAKKEYTEALVSVTNSPEDAEQFLKLDLGVVTLRKVATGYVQAVTGFPTQPPSTSPKR